MLISLFTLALLVLAAAALMHLADNLLPELPAIVEALIPLVIVFLIIVATRFWLPIDTSYFVTPLAILAPAYAIDLFLKKRMVDLENAELVNVSNMNVINEQQRNASIHVWEALARSGVAEQNYYEMERHLDEHRKQRASGKPTNGHAQTVDQDGFLRDLDLSDEKPN